MDKSKSRTRTRSGSRRTRTRSGSRRTPKRSRQPRQSRQSKITKKNIRIIILGEDWCPWCRNLTQELQSNNIPYYKPLNGTKDHSTLKSSCDKRGYTSIPAVWINGRFVGGFESTRQKLAKLQLLNLNKPYNF